MGRLGDRAARLLEEVIEGEFVVDGRLLEMGGGEQAALHCTASLGGRGNADPFPARGTRPHPQMGGRLTRGTMVDDGVVE